MTRDEGARRQRLRSGLGLAVLALAIAGALFAARALRPKHLLTVEPGALYRSATLPEDQLESVVERYGIRTVVNLRSQLENELGDWHAREARLLEQRGVRLIDLPMHSGHPPDEGALAAWLDLIDDPESRPILVHCEYGVVRTGMMVSVFEIERHDRDPAEVWRDFELWGGELEEPILSRVADFVSGYRTRASTE